VIGALLLVLALQAGEALGTLSIRVRDSVRVVPIVLERSGPMVRVDLVAAALGGSLRDAGEGRYVLAAAGSSLELTAGAPFVSAGGEALPLPYEPAVRRGQLFAPYALVSDVLPRASRDVVFDARRGELRYTPSAPTVAERRATPPARDAARARPSSSTASPARTRHLVVVDAGHGGPDRGMTGPIGRRQKIHEKDITLEVSRALRAQLRQRGVDVLMTRDADTLIALADRGQIANRAKADLFLSIHVNAANPRWRDPGAARGFETYFLSEAKTEDERHIEAIENDVVRYEAAAEVGKDDPLGFILRDMAQNEYLRESRALAAVVQRRVARLHPGPNRGVKQAGFRVLVTALMPAVLIEIGFGTNPQEAAYIKSAEGQRELAVAIAEATIEYLAEYDRRTSAGSP
jgi:N-acetylmuramoyl-L-alanine amidase